MPKFDDWGVTLLLVTGASRGLGSSICEEMSKYLASGSVIVGLARTTAGLEETKCKVKTANPNVEFISKSLDVGSATNQDLQEVLDKILVSKKFFDRTLLIHNAGTLGELKLLKNIEDSESIKTFYDINISSVLPLTTLFLRCVRSNFPTALIHVVNISSLMAIQAFKTFGLYCSVKAARDMLFKVLAMEEEDVDVLSYAPGPLDNDMQGTIRNSTTVDPEIVSLFASMKEEGKLVATSTSAAKLIKTLQNSKYKSGDHVDFYDDLFNSEEC